MIIELRKKAQITIPKEFVIALGLSAGDALDIRLEDGMIRIEPVDIVARKISRAIPPEPKVLQGVPDKYADGTIPEPEVAFLPDSEEKE